MNTSRRLARSNTDRIIGGVAGGIANYLGIDPTLVRLAFVALVLIGGVSPLIYLVLWVVLPNENAVDQPFSQQVRTNISEIEQKATSVASRVGSQIGQLVGSDQGTANTTSTTSSQASSTTQRQDEGPATGPTTRL